MCAPSQMSKEPLDVPNLGLFMSAKTDSDEEQTVAKPSTTVVSWCGSTHADAPHDAMGLHT
jgi:hypothetical protein